MDVLIYVEDPGAANFVARVPSGLRSRGYSVLLGTRGNAKSYLEGQGIDSVVIPESVTAESLLESCRPRVLLVGTSEDLEPLGLNLIAHAKGKNIGSVGVVDGVANAAFRFRGKTNDPLAFSPGWLLVPDGPTKKAYVHIGFPAERIVVVGHPRYEEVKDQAGRFERIGLQELRRRLYPGARKNQKIAVFLSEISTGLNPEQFKRSKAYRLSGRGKSIYRTEIVVEEFLDAIAPYRSDVYAVLRLHPKNKRQDLARYHREFDQVSHDEPALEVVYASDLNVGMTTILLQEAALMGKRTLSIVPREEERAWLPGSIECVTERFLIRERMKELLFSEFVPDPGPLVTVSEPLARVLGFVDDVLSGKKPPAEQHDTVDPFPARTGTR